MARLACIVAVLLVPLLLLANPGRASTRGRGPDDGARASNAPRARHTAPVASSPSPSWAVVLVAPADYRRPVPTTTSTTTTTTGPPKPVPAARAASVPVTTVAPPAPTTTLPPPPPPTTTAPAHEQTGQASWYQVPAGTCASPSLPFGTEVTVTDTANGRSTRCTVDDRMDSSTGRVLDLAEATFAQLADPSVGVIEVRLSW